MLSGKSMRFRCDCGGKLYCKETRAASDAIYRTRQCQDCKWFFTTKEEIFEGGIPNHVRRGLAKKQADTLDVKNEMG